MTIKSPLLANVCNFAMATDNCNYSFSVSLLLLAIAVTAIGLLQHYNLTSEGADLGFFIQYFAAFSLDFIDFSNSSL